MDIDPHIANWVLEYLVRQPIEYRTLNSILLALPLPTDNPNLQKSLLLKKLESEVSRCSVSESTLDLLEQLEEIEFGRGNEAVSEAMKQAYWAVAVDCTFRPLKTGNDHDKLSHVEMVERVWFGRMKKVAEKGGGLCSNLLSAWYDEIEAAAVWDDGVWEGLLNKFERIKADDLVMVYVKEERERMGPSFLERLKIDEGLQKILGVGIGTISHEEEEAPLVVETDEAPLVAERVETDRKLARPMRINTSPLEMNNLKKRRTVRRWSLMEECTLKIGVQEYGLGNWKAILDCYGSVFVGRTHVDLKDKWRNLMRKRMGC